MLRKTPNGSTVKVTFAVPTEAGPASVVGDFNDWDPQAHPLRKRTNGTRSAAVVLPRGTAYGFRYLGEGGIWFDEPDAEGHTAEGNCLVTT